MTIIDLRNSGLITKPEGHAPLGVVLGTAMHHSVTAMSPLATEEQERAHLQAIDAFHVTKGYGGFGYHAAAFPSGRAYLCGDGQRAHVKGRNHQLWGVVLIGDFSSTMPGEKQLRAALELVRYPELPIKGHNEWALPGEGTVCAGKVNGFDWSTLAAWTPLPPPLPTDEQEIRRLNARLASTLVMDYRIRSLGIHAGHGKEVVEITEIDGSSLVPKVEIALRS